MCPGNYLVIKILKGWHSPARPGDATNRDNIGKMNITEWQFCIYQLHIGLIDLNAELSHMPWAKDSKSFPVPEVVNSATEPNDVNRGFA